MFSPLQMAKQHLNQDLPLIVAKTAVIVPFPLQSLVMETVLQRIFSDALRDGELDFLQDHCIQIKIEDLNLSWNISRNQHSIVLLKSATPSTTIRGRLQEFIHLATRREDADTLFFQRRLVMEGNTEIGLEMKNLLDSIELENLPLPFKKGMELADIVFGKPEKES